MKRLFLTIVTILGLLPSAFAAENIPLGLRLSPETMPPSTTIQFQIFANTENSGEPIPWPTDHLLEIEYNEQYPEGIWQLHSVLSLPDLRVLPNNTFEFHAPSAVNYWRATIKSGIGDRFATAIFRTKATNPIFDFSPTICSDIRGHWSEPIITEMINEELFPLESKNCRPDQEISRERLITWLLNIFYPELAIKSANIDLTYAQNPYKDLTPEFGKYVFVATEANLVQGQAGCAKLNDPANCQFGSTEIVNRAEILRMVIEARGLTVDIADLKANFPEKDPIKMFIDIDNADDWFYDDLYFATAHEIIHGIKTPNGQYRAAMNQGLTYSQAAKIISVVRGLN